MTERQLAVSNLLAYRFRQLQQADEVRDRAAFLAQPLCQLRLSQAQLVDESAVCGGAFDGIQVLAMDVFHQAIWAWVKESKSRTMAGIVFNPASFAARRRRSPAISS